MHQYEHHQHPPANTVVSVAASVVSIQVSRPRTICSKSFTSSGRQSWTTGFFKKPVSGPVWLSRTNLHGDEQADRINHGGVHKAVCVYCKQHYAFWQTRLQRNCLPEGAFGENLTVRGIAEADVCIGDVWRIGEAAVQVSQPRQPCWKLARRWQLKDLALRVQQSGRTGWYFRVLETGHVTAGLTMMLVDRTYPEWTIARANQIMHHDKQDRDAAASLAAVPLLSPSWQNTLRERSMRG